MLRISATDERLARPGVSKNSVSVMVVFDSKSSCNEYDLLMSDLDEVINKGAEGISSADAAIPCFTEVTNQYLSNGVYAGVAMTSSKMLDKEATVVSIRGSPVLALAARYGGIVTQINRGNKNWRQGDHMIIGPEYKPPQGRCLSTWYPVVRGGLFHSNIFNLLCAAFGEERDGWRPLLLASGEKIPVNETKGNPLPDLDAADGVAMIEFLEAQRALWWTRLSYVTAKLFGTGWTPDKAKAWIRGFYDGEEAIAHNDGTAVGFLVQECDSLLDCLEECKNYHARARKKDPITKYTANALSNGTDVGAFEAVKAGASEAERKAMVNDPTSELTNIGVKALAEVVPGFRAAVAGLYKRTMLFRVRGIARSDSVVGGQGLIEML